MAEEIKEEKKEVKRQPSVKGEAAKKPVSKKEERAPTSIIRLAGKDVNGNLNIERALDQVRGIGSSMAHALAVSVEKKLNIPKSTTLGALSEEQVESIEELIKTPPSSGIPQYMLNHNKDMESGKNLHLVGNELLFAARQDVNRDVANRTWRGHRHQYGQKVRGQHTRSTGRTGTTVGVMKKAEAAKQMPAKAGEGGGKAAPAAPAAAAAAPAKKEEKKPAAPA